VVNIHKPLRYDMEDYQETDMTTSFVFVYFVKMMRHGWIMEISHWIVIICTYIAFYRYTVILTGLYCISISKHFCSNYITNVIFR
jgi:hypothetical protein